MKVYGWDDNVIISGANLSNDYFINRQDRYVLFHDYDMSHFYYKLIGTFCGFSSHVRPNGTIHNFLCIIILYIVVIVTEDQRLQLLHDISTIFQPSSLPAIKTIEEEENEKKKSFNYNNTRTYVLPTIQYGIIGARLDEMIYHDLLSKISMKFYEITSATAYMNYPLSTLRQFNGFETHIELLTSTPIANSFYSDKSAGGFIPRFYSAVYINYSFIIYLEREKNIQ